PLALSAPPFPAPLHDALPICSAAQLRALAFVERLERHEHDAGIRAVSEPTDREPREGHRALDARLLERDIAHAADDESAVAFPQSVEHTSELQSLPKPVCPLL